MQFTYRWLPGILLLSMVIGKIADIVQLLENLANRSSFHTNFILVGVSKDAGESAIASKIDLAGKVMVISLSVPILTSLVETITKLLP